MSKLSSSSSPVAAQHRNKIFIGGLGIKMLHVIIPRPLYSIFIFYCLKSLFCLRYLYTLLEKPGMYTNTAQSYSPISNPHFFVICLSASSAV